MRIKIKITFLIGKYNNYVKIKMKYLFPIYEEIVKTYS